MRVMETTVKFKVTFSPGLTSSVLILIVPFSSLIVKECCIVSLLWNVTMSRIETSVTRIKFRANCCLYATVSPLTVKLYVGGATVCAETRVTKDGKAATTNKHATMMSAKLLIPRPSGCRSHLEIFGQARK